LRQENPLGQVFACKQQNPSLVRSKVEPEKTGIKGIIAPAIILNL